MAEVVVSIVNTSNRELLLRCLETLTVPQERRRSVEIVVLDNASEDGSVDAVREAYPDVRVIAQPHRDGFGANHNTVVEATDSPYVFILNDDTEVSPGTIDHLVDHLEEHPRCAACGPRIIGPDGLQQGSAWRLMTPLVQAAWALTLGQRGAVVSTGDEAKVVGAVSACAMMVRRQDFERAGAFDPRFFIFSEEADLAKRLAAIDREMHYVPTVELLHHGQQTTSSVPDRQINEHWRSMRLYLAEHHRRPAALLIEWLTGLGYLLATIAAEIGGRLPARVRPAAAARWNPAIYRLHVRNAFLGTQGEGIREAADAWNRRHGVGPG